MNKFWNDVIQGFASAQPGFTPVTSYYTSASQAASAPAVAPTAATQQTTSNTPNRPQGATAEDVYRATHLAEEQVKRSNTYPKYLIDPSKPYGYKPFKRSRESSSIQRFLNSQGYNLEVPQMVTVPNHLSTLGQFTPVFRNDYYASLSPEDAVAVEAAQYQKRGGCMYKRGKRVK